MPSQSDNPALPLRLRGLTLVGSLALLGVGLGLFFAPAVVQPVWPWQIGALGGFFWGAVCLAALGSMVLVLYYARWWPARLVLPMLVVFSGSVLIVSLLNIQRFNLDRWSTWVWFALHLALPAVTAEYLWRHRDGLRRLHIPRPERGANCCKC
jgi:hypothetical protein